VEDLLVAIMEANGDEALLLLPEVVCFIICFHAAPDVQVRQLNRSLEPAQIDHVHCRFSATHGFPSGPSTTPFGSGTPVVVVPAGLPSCEFFSSASKEGSGCPVIVSTTHTNLARIGKSNAVRGISRRT
jgi:hypothetical protein